MEVFQVIEDVNVRDLLDHKKDKSYEDVDRGLYASMEAAVQAIDKFVDQELKAAMQKADEAWVSAYPAEEFVDVMKMHTDAVFVGTNTAGTSGQPYTVNLPSGGSYRICTRRCIAQNGEDIYNKGFSPDVRITVTLSDFLDGCDKAMETALSVTRERFDLSD